LSFKQQSIIISPSGNFYGSEQVLFDYLRTTGNHYLVCLPKNSLFERKIKSLELHTVVGFKNPISLYLRVCYFFLVYGCSTLYINEGGHIKYAKLMAYLFPKRKVLVHIRLIEDTKKERIGTTLPDNLQLVSISEYIHNLLPSHLSVVKVYDPMEIIGIQRVKRASKQLHVGIIGRVTPSKGLGNIDDLLAYLLQQENASNFTVHFFGDIEKELPTVKAFFEKYGSGMYSNILFHGFVENQNDIYPNLDVVVHLNEHEPLGRIGLESWARGIPFICLDQGGTAEINKMLGMSAYIIKKTDGWEKNLLELISSVALLPIEKDIAIAQKNMERHFSLDRYVAFIDEILTLH
jgi:glycosyltransferase involved in cell wall biosynthesis